MQAYELVREKLQTLYGQRRKFTATVSRFGTKTGYDERLERTILLVNVKDAASGQLVTGHVWLTVRKQFSRQNLQIGDSVEFCARVDSYVKGYLNRREDVNEREVDYTLKFPTKLRKTVTVSPTMQSLTLTNTGV